MGVLGQRSVVPGILKCGRWDTVTGVGVRPWSAPSKSAVVSGKPGQSGVPQSSRLALGGRTGFGHGLRRQKAQYSVGIRISVPISVLAQRHGSSRVVLLPKGSAGGVH